MIVWRFLSERMHRELSAPFEAQLFKYDPVRQVLLILQLKCSTVGSLTEELRAQLYNERCCSQTQR